MSNFIRVTEVDGDEQLVNLKSVLFIFRHDDSGSRIVFEGKNMTPLHTIEDFDDLVRDLRNMRWLA